MAPADAYIGLGSNQGDRLAALQGAVRQMAGWAETVVLATSAVYETEAHVLPGSGPQPDHLNAVVRLQTALVPRDLLVRLQVLERAAGRSPDAPRWSPRPLDLDLLLYDDLQMQEEALTLPHPRLPLRRFVLQPLHDLAPELVVPGLGRAVADLLAATPDTARIVQTHTVLAIPGGDAGAAQDPPDDARR